jgi:hypothetical protein
MCSLRLGEFNRICYPFLWKTLGVSSLKHVCTVPKSAHQQRLDVSEIEIPADLKQDQLLALDEALEELGARLAVSGNGGGISQPGRKGVNQILLKASDR